MKYDTSELCDIYQEDVNVVEPLFSNFGGRSSFGGQIITVKCFEDNGLLYDLLEQNGRGHILLIDGGGSVRRALIDADLARLAVQNEWEGLVVYGAVRQVDDLEELDIGIRPQLTRRVKRHDAVPLSFADGYPYLLANEASLRDLQQRCPASVSIEQFRPNLVVTGAAAWDEDSWKVIRIGEVVFDVAKPCSRCIFTTVSPERGQKHPAGEPLETLKRFRTALDNGDVDFGQNLIARNSGVIRVGDEVEILTRGPAKAYGAGESDDTPAPEAQQQATVAIEWQGQQFTGNNQQVLLEQLEQQGIRVPYSCRAGICGSCRIRLEEGEVSPLKKNAVAGDGTILACSCVPKTALRLAP